MNNITFWWQDLNCKMGLQIFIGKLKERGIQRINKTIKTQKVLIQYAFCKVCKTVLVRLFSGTAHYESNAQPGQAQGHDLKTCDC